jgi:hypothetical protein
MGEGGNSVFFGFLLAGGSTYVCSSVWFFFFVLCENEENIYKYFLYIFLVFLKVFLPCV